MALLEKEKMLVTSTFSFSSKVFYLFIEKDLLLSYHLSKIVSFGQEKNLIIWKRIKVCKNCKILHSGPVSLKAVWYFIYLI